MMRGRAGRQGAGRGQRYGGRAHHAGREHGALVAAAAPAGGRGRILGRGRDGRGRQGRGRGIPEVPNEVPPIFVGIFPGHHQEQHVNVLEQQQAVLPAENIPLLVVPFVFPRCSVCDRAHLPPARTDFNITSAADMLCFGLGLMGWEPVGHVTNSTRFKAHYGIDAEGIFAMFNDLQESALDRTDPRTLLMAMNFLKCYETEPCMASRWRLKEATIRVKVRDYVRRIQQLKEKKIIWGMFGDEVHIMTVDGVHCRIEEPRVENPGSAHYSHKFNAAGVDYELGIAIYSSRLVWISGPFPASTHDLTIFRGGKTGEDKDPNALIFKIPAGRKAIADSAYGAEASADGKIVISQPEDPPDLQRFKARAKARHETFNGRLKGFRVLNVPYRGLRLQHASAFEAVCVAVQYAMENGHPLFDMLHAA